MSRKEMGLIVYGVAVLLLLGFFSFCIGAGVYTLFVGQP